MWLPAEWSHRWLWLAAGLVGALVVIFGIGLLVTSGTLITAAAARPLLADLALFFVAVRFFGLGRASLRYIERLLSHELVFRQLGRLRIQLFRAWVRTAAVIQLRWRSGDLLQRWTSDLERLQEAPLRILLPAIAAAIVALTTGVLLWLMAPPLAVAFGLAVAWLGLAWPLLCMRLHNRNGIRRILANRKLQYRLAEGRLGIEELWLTGGAATWKDDLLRRLDTIDNFERREAHINGMQDTVATATSLALQLAMLLLVAAEVTAGAIGWPLAAGILLGTAAAMEGFTSLAPGLTRFAELQAIQRKIAAGEPEEHPESQMSTVAPSHPQPSGFELRNICFAIGRTPVLNDVSFSLPNKGMVLIGGPSGSGKTTLGKIIVGLHEPQRGVVSLQHDPSPLSAAQRRPLFAACLQEIPLLRRSLRDNLKLGDDTIADDSLLRLLDRFGLTARFAPNPLDAILDDHAIALSGGEIKRLGLIRALARKDVHLLLDEPFEHLDPDTAEVLCQEIADAANHRLIVIISHIHPRELVMVQPQPIANSDLFICECRLG